MNFNEYIPLALRTLKDRGLSLNILHGISGAGTEIGELVDAYKRKVFYGTELDIINITEEVGDVLWYIALLADQLNVKDLNFELYPLPTELKGIQRVSVEPANILLALNLSFNEVGQMSISFMEGMVDEERNVLKAEAVASLTSELSALLNGLKYNCLIMGVDIVEAAKANIAKLKKRYPDKFTEEAATNRDLEGERDVLELHIN